MNGFAAGDKINIGTPANLETVTVTAVGGPGAAGASIDFTPALAQAHVRFEDVMQPGTGTGLDLAAPLKFNHAANLPFSDRGSGIELRAANGLCPLEQRTRASARHRHHALDSLWPKTTRSTRWCGTRR